MLNGQLLRSFKAQPESQVAEVSDGVAHLKMLVPWQNCGALSDLSAFVGQWSIPRRPMEHVSAGFLERNSPPKEKKNQVFAS